MGTLNMAAGPPITDPLTSMGRISMYLVGHKLTGGKVSKRFYIHVDTTMITDSPE